MFLYAKDYGKMYTTPSFSCYNIFNFSCPFHTVLIPPGQGVFNVPTKKKLTSVFMHQKTRFQKIWGKYCTKVKMVKINISTKYVSTIVYLYPCVCTLLLIRPIYGVKCRYMARSEGYTTFQMLRGHYWALA